MFEEFLSGELRSVFARTSFHLVSDALVAVVSGIQGYDRRWPRRAANFEAAYPLQDNLVLIELWMDSLNVDAGENSIEIHLHQSLEPVGGRKLTRRERNLTRKFVGVNAILSLLGSLSGSVEFQCRSVWSLDFARWTPRIALPLLHMDILGTRFQRISGVRLTSAQPGVYDSAIVDMTNETSFHVAVSFELEGPISEELFETVNLESRRIRDSLVFRKDMEEEATSNDAGLVSQ